MNNPVNKKTNLLTAHASDLTSDKFWLFPAILENSVLGRIRLASNLFFSHPNSLHGTTVLLLVVIEVRSVLKSP